MGKSEDEGFRREVYARVEQLLRAHDSAAEAHSKEEALKDSLEEMYDLPPQLAQEIIDGVKRDQARRASRPRWLPYTAALVLLAVGSAYILTRSGAEQEQAQNTRDQRLVAQSTSAPKPQAATSGPPAPQAGARSVREPEAPRREPSRTDASPSRESKALPSSNGAEASRNGPVGQSVGKIKNLARRVTSGSTQGRSTHLPVRYPSKQREEKAQAEAEQRTTRQTSPPRKRRPRAPGQARRGATRLVKSGKTTLKVTPRLDLEKWVYRWVVRKSDGMVFRPAVTGKQNLDLMAYGAGAYSVYLERFEPTLKKFRRASTVVTTQVTGPGERTASPTKNPTRIRIWLDSDNTVNRQDVQPAPRNLSWVVRHNGRVQLQRSARSELSYKHFRRDPGTYQVHLQAYNDRGFSNSGYEQVSNVVTYQLP